MFTRNNPLARSLLFLTLLALAQVCGSSTAMGAGFDWNSFIDENEKEVRGTRDASDPPAEREKLISEIPPALREPSKKTEPPLDPVADFVKSLSSTLGAKVPIGPMDLTGAVASPTAAEALYSRTSTLAPIEASGTLAVKRSGRGDLELTGDGFILLPDEVNNPVTLDVTGVDVVTLLRGFAKHLEKMPGKKSYSAFFAPDLAGQVNVTWINVPLQDAINILLKEQGIIVEKAGPILRFIKKENATPIQKTFGPFGYITVEEAKAVATPLLSADGRIAESLKSKTITVYDRAAVMPRIQEILADMDIPPPAPRADQETVTETILLKYLDGASLKTLIKAQLPTLTATITEFSTNEGVAGAGTAQAGRKDILIVSALRKDLETIRELINKLDIQPSQIIIDAQIFEINLEDEDHLGINWDFRLPQPNGTSTGVSDLFTFSQNTGGGSTSIFRYGTLDIQQFTAVLGFLKTKSDAKVLSNPVITTLNNQQANITVGSQVPYKTTTVNNGVTVENTNFAAANITLNVTPSITGDDNVFLTLAPTVSNVTGITDSGPTIGQRSAQTVVLVKNNHTIVIGGLVKNDRTFNEEKFPVLGDLPLVGKAFRKRTYKNVKSELLFFITPHIVRDGKIVTDNLVPPQGNPQLLSNFSR